MIIDNSNYAVKNKLLRMGMIVGFVASMTIIAMLPELDKKMGFSRYVIMAGISLVFVIIATFRFFSNYCYVYLSTDLGKITVRWYHLVSAFRKFRAFEFPIAEYHKHEIVKQGLKQDLVIYRKEGNKITRYPSISITALKKPEIERVEKVLNSIKNR